MTSIDRSDAAEAVASLLRASAVRTRSRMIFDEGRLGSLPHFTLDLDKLPACARYVTETIRQNYPTLKVPPHSRWRHLDANGHSWADRLGDRLSKDRDERARQRIELAVTSVLLDAGAGSNWKWRDPVTGRDFGRSEGLALASLEAFREGLFSSDPAQPCRADAEGLESISSARLANCFQVGASNPISGFSGRVELMQRLGRSVRCFERPFGRPARIGHFYDVIKGEPQIRSEGWPSILESVLMMYMELWPRRLEIEGFSLGDTWQHSAIRVPGLTKNLIPFHKLSQWLTYSLVEPLEEAGIDISNLDGLTGLAEYRNGGLFIDMGVIVPRDPLLLTKPLTPDQEPIVEWRALTVALLDEIAPLVRKELGVTAAQMPLASILEGGTWAAGRRIAKEKRADGGPPLNIISDGTVF